MVADGVIAVQRLPRFTIITIVGYDDWMKVPVIGNLPPAIPARHIPPAYQRESFRPVYVRFT